MHRTLCLVLLATAPAAAQMPSFRNAPVTRSAAGIEAALAAAQAANRTSWVGYSEPAVPGTQADCGVAYLGGRPGRDDSGAEAQASGIAILVRVENGRADRVRSISLPCEIDANGDAVTWLSGVSAAQSVKAIEALAQTGVAGATAALGMSAGGEAEAALERLAGPSAEERTREQAVFWLGSTRGHSGFTFLQGLAANPATGEALRRRLTFAFESSRDPGAVDELIRMAQKDAAPGVRSQAIFWLAQKAGERAVGVISAAVRDDPSTQVKERALLGLSQLPDGQGVPMLIQVARGNANPAVRKRAMFWLGQSHDPRALAFFREILTGSGN